MIGDARYRMTLIKYSILLGTLLFAWGCSSSGETIVVKSEQDRPHWEAMIDSGKVGKADFIRDSLENLDAWPYPLNEREVFEKVIYSNDPVYVNTCSRFLEKKGEKYRIRSEFVIEKNGDLRYINLLNEAGACRGIVLGILKQLEFAPGIKDNSYIRTYVIYPLNLQLDG